MTSKDIVSMTKAKAVVISILFGVVGIILAFTLDEGIFPENKLAFFACLSISNFIVCLFITRAYPKSIWFAGFFINIIMWTALIFNIKEFVREWYGWTAMVIFAYAGSFVGLVLSRKKRKQVDTDQKEE
jgi:small basic protein